MKPIIELDNVWKVYQMDEVEVPALQGINIKIKPKEFVSIIGASGSGKSTTMNMIGCLDTPTKGHVFLEGQDISKLQESELAQIRGKKIGFVFQTFNLIPQLSALENVMLPMMFQPEDHDIKIKKAKDLLNKVGLKERITHLPGQLSGGERQRVAIARALSNSPEVILADEPTGNLDSKSGKEIMSIIRGLNNEGTTIILVTHDMSIARNAQRTIKMVDGKVTR